MIEGTNYWYHYLIIKLIKLLISKSKEMFAGSKLIRFKPMTISSFKADINY